ncbi:hypothetical protein BGY98DRAFT_935894 [Russula aff. rugulosa BPL654]|nr:hypothetical protein BGY98DRAFT_935894 [Russula aff. rugulosa BPL654]
MLTPCTELRQISFPPSCIVYDNSCTVWVTKRFRRANPSYIPSLLPTEPICLDHILMQEGSPAHIVREYKRLPQFHVAMYMDNDIAGIPQALLKSGRSVESIRARLKKEGRFCGNLMRKCAEFSAQTVITGDPNLELDGVGVPRLIAITLTYPERGICPKRTVNSARPNTSLAPLSSHSTARAANPDNYRPPPILKAVIQQS